MKNNFIGEFIANRRNELNISQGELANKLGYSSQLVYNWEKGKSYPDLSSLSGLCNILKVTLKEFLSAEINGEFKEKLDNFNYDNFSNNLKKLRKINSVTQKELADEAGVSYATIISWEKGASTPNLVQFILLKNFFGYLLTIYIMENHLIPILKV